MLKTFRCKRKLVYAMLRLKMFLSYEIKCYLQCRKTDFNNTFSLPTRHILTLGQDPLASLFDAQSTPLESFFDVQGPPLL